MYIHAYTHTHIHTYTHRERDRQIDRQTDRQIDRQIKYTHTHTHLQVHVVGPSGTTVSLGVRKKSSGLVSEIKLTRGPTPPEHKALLHQKPHLSPVHTHAHTHTHTYVYVYIIVYVDVYIHTHTHNYTSGIALVYAPVTISPCTAELQWEKGLEFPFEIPVQDPEANCQHLQRAEARVRQ